VRHNAGCRCSALCGEENEFPTVGEKSGRQAGNMAPFKLLPSSIMKTIAKPEELELGTSLPPEDRHVSDMTHHHHDANLIGDTLTKPGRQRPPAKMA
jgi:hypothetical protein